MRDRDDLYLRAANAIDHAEREATKEKSPGAPSMDDPARRIGTDLPHSTIELLDKSECRLVAVFAIPGFGCNRLVQGCRMKGHWKLGHLRPKEAATDLGPGN